MEADFIYNFKQVAYHDKDFSGIRFIFQLYLN